MSDPCPICGGATRAGVLRWIRLRNLEAVARGEDDHQDAPPMATVMAAADPGEHLGEATSGPPGPSACSRSCGESAP